MRKSLHFYAIAFALAGLFIFGFIQLNEDPNADLAPQSDQFNYPVYADTIKPPTFPYATLFNFNYSLIGGMNGGTVGAMFFNNMYYFNRWNSTLTYRYNNSGPGGGPGTVVDSLTYVGSCRDLCTDGIFIYGGQASTTFYRFNPSTMAILKTFVLSGGAARATAWDPNRKGFWNTNFGGNIFLHDTNGVLKQTITSALTGKYGMGFDSTSSADSAFLWVWNQGTGSTTNELHKIHIQSGTTKAIYIFTLTGASVGIAGGAEVIANVIPGKLTLLCNYQNQALVGYNLKDIVTSVKNENQIPDKYSLSQNYPNPFNPATNINYSIPKTGLVTLSIFDITGKEVAVLVNAVKTAGNYAVEFNGSGLSSGIYFYKLTSGEFSSVKKMMLIK